MPRLAPELAEEIAAQLVARAGSSDVAFLLQRDTIYFARGADELRAAATVLVQGVCGSLPRDAHFILRNAIHATRPPGAFALGIVKVAARKIRVVEPRARGISIPFEMREVTAPPLPSPHGGDRAVPAADSSHEEWLRFAGSLVPESQDDLPRHARDRRVGAALVAEDGRLLAASANTNGANRTLHAELNVLLATWERTRARLAPGTRLYATLRPCKMCAGLVWDLAEQPGTVAVYYAEDDPGSAARNTVLCPGSDARALFARTPAEREAPGCIAIALGTDVVTRTT